MWAELKHSGSRIGVFVCVCFMQATYSLKSAYQTIKYVIQKSPYHIHIGLCAERQPTHPEPRPTLEARQTSCFKHTYYDFKGVDDDEGTPSIM